MAVPTATRFRLGFQVVDVGRGTRIPIDLGNKKQNQFNVGSKTNQQFDA